MTDQDSFFGRWEKVIKTMLGPPVCKECGLLQVEVFDVGCLGTGNCRWPLADMEAKLVERER